MQTSRQYNFVDFFFFLNELLPEDLEEELLCVPCSVMLNEHHNMAVFQSLKTVECCEAHFIYSSVAQTVCSVHACVREFV